MQLGLETWARTTKKVTDAAVIYLLLSMTSRLYTGTQPGSI